MNDDPLNRFLQKLAESPELRAEFVELAARHGAGPRRRLGGPGAADPSVGPTGPYLRYTTFPPTRV